MRLTRLACALVVSSIAAFCATTQESPSNPCAHRIEVLALDGNSGKPVRDAWVSLRAMGQSEETNWLRTAQSNSQGLAEFFLVDPIPDKVALSFETNVFALCSDAQFPTERILKSGVIAGDFCATAKVYSSHPPLAGQLVMYGRAVTTWDRVSRAIPFLSLFR